MQSFPDPRAGPAAREGARRAVDTAWVAVMMGMNRRSSNSLRLAIATAVGLVLVACATRVDTRGNLPDPDQLAELRPGKDSRDDVTRKLGSPSSVNVFGQEIYWYYISQLTETAAFFAPEVKSRKVVILEFDQNGILSGVETKGLEDARDVVPVERETPTAGNELTIFDQLIGNLGRFEKQPK